jgi:diacylglycerol kinase (ATP)
MKGMLIYNPTAGRFPSLPLVERAVNLLRNNDWEIALARTDTAQDITRFSQNAAEHKLDAVFVAGGDGSIHRAAAGLLGSKTALAVLPAGTANVWAQELGLPGLSWTNWNALEASVKKLLQGQVRTMDVGICQDRPFLLWAGIGFDAFIVHHLEPRSRLEKQFAVPQYAANLAWLAREWSGMDLEICVDQEPISGSFILALISNVHLYAGGLAKLSNQARIDDQQMELWLFSGNSLATTMQHVWNVITGAHKKSNQVSRYPCQKIRIQSAGEIYLQLDGEPLPPTREIEVHIKPKALRVLVPKELPRQLFSEDVV